VKKAGLVTPLSAIKLRSAPQTINFKLQKQSNTLTSNWSLTSTGVGELLALHTNGTGNFLMIQRVRLEMRVKLAKS
jgi:hypothetical protein